MCNARRSIYIVVCVHVIAFQLHLKCIAHKFLTKIKNNKWGNIDSAIIMLKFHKIFALFDRFYACK